MLSMRKYPKTEFNSQLRIGCCILVVCMFAHCATCAEACSTGGGLMAVDALGRAMPEAGEIASRENRLVGLFYFLCLGEHGKCGGPYDISKILAADPDAGQKPESSLWGPWNETHHWGEPLYGYYCAAATSSAVKETTGKKKIFSAVSSSSC